MRLINPIIPGEYRYPTITPFTIPDGHTYLKTLERLVKCMKSLIDSVNENNEEMQTFVIELINSKIEEINTAFAEFEGEIDDKLASVDTKISDLETFVNTKISDLETFVNTEVNDLEMFVNDSVQQIINNSIEVQDPVVAELLDDPDSDSRIIVDNIFYNKNKLNMKNAFKRRVIHNLAYAHEDASEARTKFGVALYPQAFCVDRVRNEILVISAAPQIVSTYDATTGAYKNVYSLGTEGTTEGVFIKYISGRRYLYTIFKQGQLARYDITDEPMKLTEVVVGAKYDVDSWTRLTELGGIITTGARASVAGSAFENAYVSRARMFQYDLSMNRVGFFDASSAVGGGVGDYSSSVLPKIQGVSAIPGGYAFPVGGGFSPGSQTETNYQLQGIRVTTPTGEMMADALVKASDVFNVLDDLGYQPGSIIETEGSSYDGENLYSLMMISGGNDPQSSTGGILIIEEFSEHPDAIDFEPYTYSQTFADPTRYQSGLHPITRDNEVLNLATMEALTTIGECCEYMRNVGQMELNFYTNRAGIVGVNGEELPAGALCSIKMLSSDTFSVTFERFSVGGYFVIWSGGEWVKQINYGWVPIPFADGFKLSSTVSGNRFATCERGGYITLKINVASVDGNLAVGTSTIAEPGAITEGHRPREIFDSVLTSPSGGSARVTVQPDGSIQVNVPTGSTYTYLKGVLVYPS